MSWLGQVIADASGQWTENALRFQSEREATEYVRDLSVRWTAVRSFRVKESTDDVNAVWRDGHLTMLSGLQLTLLEVQHTLVIVRVHRLAISERMLQLQEKLRLGWDGPTSEAVLVCDNELHLLNGIIAKLWQRELELLAKW